MPTRRGWLLAGGALALVVAGRLLGLLELWAMGVAAAVLLVVCVALIRLSRPDIGATRRLAPSRVPAGAASRVDLMLTNRSTLRSPTLAVREPFDHGRRWARFRVAPLPPGATSAAAYRVPTDQRGVFTLGPLELTRTDPFGLASATTVAATAATLIVYPRVDRVVAMPHTRGHDPRGGATPRRSLGRAGEEFYALRPYVVGDDLRRVHWPSTARLDELQIRQDELPWQGRATVVVDVRKPVHTAESFETALSGAASILSACARSGSEIRLVTTAGVDSESATGHTHLDFILELLAAATPKGTGPLAPAMTILGRDGGAGAVAVLTTSQSSPVDLEGVARLERTIGSVTLVVVETTAGSARPAVPHLPSLGTMVRVPAGAPFAPAWDQAITGGRTVRSEANRGFASEATEPASGRRSRARPAEPDRPPFSRGSASESASWRPAGRGLS